MPWESGYILGDNFFFYYTTLCFSCILSNVYTYVCTYIRAKESWTFFAFFGQVGKTVPCQDVLLVSSSSTQVTKKLNPFSVYANNCAQF